MVVGWLVQHLSGWDFIFRDMNGEDPFQAGSPVNPAVVEVVREAGASLTRIALVVWPGDLVVGDTPADADAEPDVPLQPGMK
jgi:hypothetical protein